ncbi:hypothetical protein, partial [Halobacillus trueperi]|uniref:hypothetical protein n=1 Tax=Halobacillus trueperi TaxID=156205 RepID=UPI001C6E8B64
MMKVNPYRVLFLMVGLLYIIMLILSSFSEVGNVFRLRTPFFGDVPNNNYLPFSTIVTYFLN